jgi:nucleotide-binding universal stress UspA family protein
MSGYRRILVAVDGSPSSQRAVAEAARLAKADGGRLILLYVANTGAQDASVKMWENLKRAFIEEGQGVLEEAEKVADEARVPSKTKLEEGYPSEKIVEVAADQDADLIVLGCRGRSKLAKILLGSVASRVIAAAHCPVLVVREQ